MTLKVFKGGTSLINEKLEPVGFDTEVSITADCEPLSPEREKKVIAVFRKAFKKALKEIQGTEF